MRFVVGVLALLVACGRIDFTPIGSGDDDGGGSGDSGGSIVRKPCALTSNLSLTVDAFTTDAAGNAYVLIGLNGSISLGSKMFTNADPFPDLIAVSLDPSCTVRWAHPFAVTFGGFAVTGRPAMVVDGMGTVTIAADFAGTIDPGDGAHVSNGGGTTSDLFVAQLGADGGLVWFRQLGGTTADLVGGLALLPNGDVVLGGTFTGAINLGAGNVSSAGAGDIFVAGYSHAGVLRPGKPFGGTGDDYLSRIAVDAGGTIYGAGSYTGATNLGTGMLANAGGNDAFAARYSQALAAQMTTSCGGTGDQFAFAVAVDASSEMTIAGEFDGPINCGTGVLTPVGLRDVFVGGIATGGAARWVRQFGGTAEDQCESLVVDGAGDVVAAGAFGATVDFGDGPHTVTTQAGYVVALATDGTTRWVVTLEGSGAVDAYLVAAMPGTGVAVAGTFAGTLLLDATELDSVGQTGVFVAQVH